MKLTILLLMTIVILLPACAPEKLPEADLQSLARQDVSNAVIVGNQVYIPTSYSGLDETDLQILMMLTADLWLEQNECYKAIDIDYNNGYYSFTPQSVSMLVEETC